MNTSDDALKIERRREHNRKWYAKNREYSLAKSKEYRSQNRDALRQSNRRSYAENQAARVAAAREYRAKNADRLKAERAAKYALNREEILAANRARRRADPDKWALYQAKAREKHREAAKRRSHEWHKANPDQARAQRQIQRARKRNAEGRHTGKDIQAIFAAQRGRCAYCRVSIADGYHVDHIIALARGGSNWPRNIQLTCGPCNRKKHCADPIDFAKQMGLLI